MFDFFKNRAFGRKKAIVMAAESHVGCVRQNNEDSFVYVNDPAEQNAMAVVCDGIGGHSHGEVASFMCCSKMLEEWRNQKVGNRSDPAELKSFLEWIIEQSNQEIRTQNATMQNERPMGCTVVAAIITPNTLIVANAGDSRCYGQYRNVMTQLSFDHTLRSLMQAKSSEIIAEEDLPGSNIICKAVGPCSRVKPAVGIFERKNYRKLLLCSDGMTGMIDDDEINTILHNSRTPNAVINQLICTALKRGATDNVTGISIYC